MAANQKPVHSALEIKHLRITKADGHQEISSIPDFSLWPGESIAVMAPSGTGKTLLLKAIAGLLPETIRQAKGSQIIIGGSRTHGRKALSRRISYIPQNALNAWAPGIGVDRQFKRAINGYAGGVQELLSLVGLSLAEVQGKYPFQLSGGMCQRLLVAAAVARRPDIILADEPLGSTDRESGAKVFEVFAAEQDRGAAIIMTTHNQMDANKHCQRVIALGEGHAES